jgi:hypothetical protein
VLYNHQVGLCSSVDFETLLCKARIEQLVWSDYYRRP